MAVAEAPVAPAAALASPLTRPTARRYAEWAEVPIRHRRPPAVALQNLTQARCPGCFVRATSELLEKTKQRGGRLQTEQSAAVLELLQGALPPNVVVDSFKCQSCNGRTWLCTDETGTLVRYHESGRR
ncbi:MAG TPA: hypothetical protein VGW38_24410 [Chloroflexota bacterium]|nr:hypothetical protein [Chloroflexota bacterium]